MSVQAMGWVLDYSETTLATRLVMIAIANHADAYGVNAWPSQRKLAAEAKVDVRTVRRAIDEAVGLGELTVTPHAGQKGPGGVTSYYELAGFVRFLERANCPPSDSERGHPPPKARTSGPQRAGRMSSEPSLEPSRTAAARAAIMERDRKRRDGEPECAKCEGLGVWIDDAGAHHCECVA